MYFNPMEEVAGSYHVFNTHMPSFNCLLSVQQDSTKNMFFIIRSELGAYYAPRKCVLMFCSYKVIFHPWLLGEAEYPVCGDTK